jgi:hypothetical protein
VTGLAELCLRSRYSSGSVWPAAIDSTSGGTTTPATDDPGGCVVERVNAITFNRTSTPSATAVNRSLDRRLVRI